ncbi:MAG: hypothetical protein WCI40_01350 [Verrucomicrobiota bacterium]
MKKGPTPSSLLGFTLTEILIGLTVFFFLMAGVYSLFYCANVLTSKVWAINSTGTDAHNTLDAVQGALQTAYTKPIPIDSTGADLSTTLNITGTAATATGLAAATSGSPQITGTGPGIRFYRYVGGPYAVTIPTGGLAGTATSGTIELDNSAIPAPPVPQANDILCINTTVVPTSFQDWATVSGTPTVASTNGTRVKYSVAFTPPMKDKDGNSTSAIPYQTDNQGVAITCSATLLRPTAFIITTVISTSGTSKELRMFSSYTKNANGTVNLTGTNYRTLTRAIDTGTSTLSQFGIVTLENQNFVGLLLRVRSTDYDNYLANKQNDGFNTYMGFSSFIALKSKP